MAVLRLDGLSSTPLVTFGGSANGDILRTAGFGRDGTPSTGLALQDGNLRGAQAPRVPDFGQYADNYIRMYMDMELGVPLNGRAAPGDSGSPVFNSQDELTTLLVGGSNRTARVQAASTPPSS